MLCNLFTLICSHSAWPAKRAFPDLCLSVLALQFYLYLCILETCIPNMSADWNRKERECRWQKWQQRNLCCSWPQPLPGWTIACFLPPFHNQRLSEQEFHYTSDGWKSYNQMPVAGRQDVCNRLLKHEKQEKTLKFKEKQNSCFLRSSTYYSSINHHLPVALRPCWTRGGEWEVRRRYWLRLSQNASMKCFVFSNHCAKYLLKWKSYMKCSTRLGSPNWFTLRCYKHI